MADRHIDIVSSFVENFGLPMDLRGKKILDIGVWTGGTSLLLAAMGADVTACEEVKIYADTVNFLADAFGLTNLKCVGTSLYSIDYHDEFDYVLYAGVIYHVTDPVLSLRILYNSLKDGGDIFVETFGTVAGGGASSLCLVQGGANPDGSQESLNRTGWNYFIPSKNALDKWLETAGFENIEVSNLLESESQSQTNRFHARGSRTTHQDMLRAGLSRPDIR